MKRVCVDWREKMRGWKIGGEGLGFREEGEIGVKSGFLICA